MGEGEKGTAGAGESAEAGTTGAPAPAHAASDASPPDAATTTADNKLSEGDSSTPQQKESSPATPSTPPPATPTTATTTSAPPKDDKKSSGEDTAATEEDPAADEPATPATAPKPADGSKPVAILASSKKARPPYKYDPNKITLRFIFANRDGLTVTVECNPSDTVGEVKGALLSVWPEDLPDCDGGELLRLVCMGKGFLMPDTRTLEDCQIPVFKTHPTPVNVSVRPNVGKGSGGADGSPSKSGGGTMGSGDPAAADGMNDGTEQTSQGCACTIL